MSNWLVDKLIPSIMRSEVKKSSVPEGLWHKCPSCDAVLYRPELEKTLDVCPKCNHHMRIGARARIDIFLEPPMKENSNAETTTGMPSSLPLTEISASFSPVCFCAPVDRKSVV